MAKTTLANVPGGRLTVLAVALVAEAAYFVAMLAAGWITDAFRMALGAVVIPLAVLGAFAKWAAVRKGVS